VRQQLWPPPTWPVVRVLCVTSRSAPLWSGLTLIALALAIVGLFVWPFVFEAAASLVLLIAAKTTADSRYTAPALMVVTVCAVLGATFAIVFNHALY